MKRKKQSRSSNRKRTGNTLVFKLVDPIFQSLLFVFFIYCLDTDSQFSYNMVLLLLLGLQFLSVVVNFFIKAEEQLKGERLIYLGILVAYFVSCYFVEKSSHGSIIDLFTGNAPANLTTLLLISGLIGMAFWYFVICFREVRSLLTSKHSDYE